MLKEKTRSTVMRDLFGGGKKCRIEWHIESKAGHGEWFHSYDRPMLEAFCLDMNRTHGTGSHIVKEADI